MLRSDDYKPLVFANVGLLNVLKGIPGLESEEIFRILNAVDNEAREVESDFDPELEQQLDMDGPARRTLTTIQTTQQLPFIEKEQVDVSALQEENVNLTNNLQILKERHEEAQQKITALQS